MNYMKDVAHMLGLELGEEFKIKGDAYPCRYKHKLTEENLKFFANGNWHDVSAILVVNLLNGKAEVVKIPKPVLDEKEKEYLSYVIKPFRDRVECIYKLRNSRASRDCIIIRIKDRNSIVLPDFKKDDMYKNMKPERKYSLEDLNI